MAFHAATLTAIFLVISFNRYWTVKYLIRFPVTTLSLRSLCLQELRHQTAAMLHREEEVMPARFIMPEVRRV